MSISFVLDSSLKPLTGLLERHADPLAFAKAKLQAEVEATSLPHLLPGSSTAQHALIEAVHTAYSAHLPLVLSPDDIWLTISQGVATHIKQNAELFRGRFVLHDGQQKIVIRDDSLVRGSAYNPWPRVFTAMAQEVGKIVGESNQMRFLAHFSTSTELTRFANQVVLLDAMSSYFSYDCQTMCGIPRIELRGNVPDWEALFDKVSRFDDLQLEWWLPAVRTMLQHFVRAAQGQPDLEWWRSIYKYNGASGGPYLSGWLTWLFPYLKRYSADDTVERNSYIGQLSAGPFDGVREQQLPASYSRVPFTWQYLAYEYPYQVVSGLLGIAQDPQTLAVSPQVGWAVVNLGSPVGHCTAPMRFRPKKRY